MDAIDAIDFAILQLHKNAICQCEGCQRLRAAAIAALIDARSFQNKIIFLELNNMKLREHIRDLEGWIEGSANRGVYQ